MDSYVFINYANESREDAQKLIEMLESSGIQTVYGSASEDKIKNSSFVIHLSTSASRSSKTYRRNMNLSVRFDKDCIVMHMDGSVLLTDTETMLDTLLSVFKYSCQAAAVKEAEEKLRTAAEEIPTENETTEEAAMTVPAVSEAPETSVSAKAEPEKPEAAPEKPEAEPEKSETAPEKAAEPAAPEEQEAAEQRALSERERLYEEGRRYLEGTDGEPDPVKAFECFKQSANQGYTKAQYQLSVCYDEGIGVRRNIAEAARWCEMAAYGGYDKAQSEIGYCYEYGHGVIRNTKEAVRWYRIAAQQGNIEAKNNLAFCYQKGRGVTKNVSEAIRLYKEASDAGHASALYNLGFCYWDGEGVPVDKSKAVELFRESARRGNARAEQMMRILNQHSFIRAEREEE